MCCREPALPCPLREASPQFGISITTKENWYEMRREDNYDRIGKNYSCTRTSDPRIGKALLEILTASPGATVADIGAGTGSYALFLAQQGYRILAVEPSAVMRQQAIAAPAIEWIAANAENLPLGDHSVDAAIIMLALHHFQNDQQALREIHRITGGRQIVVFTYDPDFSRFWLTQYFPGFVSDVQSTFVPVSTLISELQTVTGAKVQSRIFPLPHDLLDSFAAVGWARPELYLSSSIRNGISSFAKLAPAELNQGLSRLQQDLETGVWDREYGHLRKQNQYDAGYRFVYTI